MSPRGNYKAFLSVKATADIEDILHYTYQQYGQIQEEKYYKIICDVLDLIESNPLVGHKRTDLSTQHWSLNAGEHVIVYKVIEKKYLFPVFCTAEWTLANDYLKTKFVINPGRLNICVPQKILDFPQVCTIK